MLRFHRDATCRIEKPLPRELHASRKFFSGGTPEEAEAANRREAAQLRELKAKALEGTTGGNSR